MPHVRGWHCNGNCCTSGDGNTSAAAAHTHQYAMPCARALRGFALALTVPHLRRDWALPFPHVHWDWGSTPSTSAPGLGSPLSTSAPGLGLDPLPHVRRDSGCWLAQVRSWAATPKVLGAFRKQR